MREPRKAPKFKRNQEVGTLDLFSYGGSRGPATAVLVVLAVGGTHCVPEFTAVPRALGP